PRLFAYDERERRRLQQNGRRIIHGRNGYREVVRLAGEFSIINGYGHFKLSMEVARGADRISFNRISRPGKDLQGEVVRILVVRVVDDQIPEAYLNGAVLFEGKGFLACDHGGTIGGRHLDLQFEPVAVGFSVVDGHFTLQRTCEVLRRGNACT